MVVVSNIQRKWLNAKFEERLAAYKREQQKELEHLKFSINAQMDRATKLHQKEFEALPEAWARLMHAHGIIMSVVSRLQSLPDLNAMPPDQLEDFLVNSKLAEWQRDIIRQAPDKTGAYRNQFEGEKMVKELEADVQKILWDSTRPRLLRFALRLFVCDLRYLPNSGRGIKANNLRKIEKFKDSDS